MYKGKKIAAVVPAHNEESFIAEVLGSIPDFFDNVFAVDDSSSDGTLRMIEELAASNPKIKSLKTPKNLGVGGATTTGFKEIIKSHRDVEIVVKIDGDGQMPLERLEDLLSPLIEGDYDYAKGNRFLKGHDLERMPKVRLLGNLILTLLTKIVSGYWNIFDSQNGFFAVKLKCLEEISLDKLHPGYFFENDLLIALNVYDFRVKDVAIPSIYGEEKSGVSIFKTGLTFPFLLFHRYWRRFYAKHILRNFSPVALFMIPGSILFTMGLFSSIYLWLRSIFNPKPTPVGTLLIVLVLLVFGFQLILQAAVLDIQESQKLS
ncbi:MAG: glycosyltransferase family 2 protein [Actinomycetota bacterium]|nr:glycosyltransferase family 2 protein [Actinomycetota bacterium]